MYASECLVELKVGWAKRWMSRRSLNSGFVGAGEVVRVCLRKASRRLVNSMGAGGICGRMYLARLEQVGWDRSALMLE